ncbi:MAG: hypothetical protein HC799_07260 [Limnothrix sp. RL_2_0]|nr:hypothetical protein [Limnothrix sp. RL_2_0]
MVGAIKEKLQQQGSVDTLTEAQENPSEQNISQFTQELMGLMLEDNEFAEDLENSLAIFSQNSEVQEIIEKGSIKIDLSSHQPLSVAHFEDVTVSEAVTTKQSLSIEDALNEK